jgi:hypothetical protein
MSQVINYDVNQVTVVVADILIDGGWAEDDVIKVEPNSDDYGFVVGAGGDVGRYKTNDPVTKVTLKLMQGSTYNDLLAAKRALDMNTPGGAGIGAFLIKDRLGRATYAGSKSFILGPPKDVTFGKGLKAREWTIIVCNSVRFDGGN